MNLEELVTEERLEKMKAAAAKRTAGLTLLFDELHHPHNISAVIRSADAFGISEVNLLCKKSELSKGITMGTEKWVTLNCFDSWNEAVDKLRKTGFRLVLASAMEGHADEQALADYDFSERTCLVFGSEKRGPRSELVEACDSRIYIPMRGFVESLNVSVAAAAALYHATQVATKGPKVLDESEQIGLIKRWLQHEAVKKGINPESLPYQLRL